MLQSSHPIPALIQHPPVFSFPKTVLTNRAGHEFLWNFYNTYKDVFNHAVVLDFSEMNFFEGNLSALLLALVHRLKTDNGMRFSAQTLGNAECTDLLLRNGMIALLVDNENEWRPDFQQSTIQARHFQVDQPDAFADYIEKELLAHRSLTGIHSNVKNWVLANFFMEAFTNVEMHAGTRHLTTCGQFFPGKRLLHFTFCDLGHGFWQKIRDYTANHPEPIQTPREAIEWAVSGGSTFRSKGGSALRRLRTYCMQSGWGLSIVTDGYLWQLKPDQQIACRPMDSAALGTTIHLIIKIL